MDPNSFEAIKSKLSPQALKDIEGLNPDEFGFGRQECCGGVPEKLPGSMKLRDHILLGTKMPPTEWQPKTENVEGFAALQSVVKSQGGGAALNVVHDSTAAPGDDCFLLHIHDPSGSSKSDAPELVRLTQYSLPSDVPLTFDAGLPWAGDGASAAPRGMMSVDRSMDYVVLVCTHLSRDKRCGYCGTVLVDLLRSCAAAKTSQAAAGGGGARVPAISVLPCSHVGGHIYAGNVVVYSRFGGVSYGLVKPSDVEALVSAMVEDKGSIPESLSNRIRGHMGPTYARLP